MVTLEKLKQDLPLVWDILNNEFGKDGLAAIDKWMQTNSIPIEPPVKPACVNCKYVYNDKDIEQILYCRNPKFAEYVSVVFGGCDGSISVNENFGCIDFESKSV